MVFDVMRDAGLGWVVQRAVNRLWSACTPQDAMAKWGSMCDEVAEQDLKTTTEAKLALASGIRRKRLDGWVVHWGWGSRRSNDYLLDCQDRCETTEEYKNAQYQPLRDKMAEALTCAWSVEIVNFTMGIRGSYAETCWTEALTALGV